MGDCNERMSYIHHMEYQRSSIARQLHSGVGQSLSNAAMRAEIAKRLLEQARTEEAVTQIDKVLEFVRAAVTETQQLMFSLNAGSLEQPLGQALERQVDRIMQKTGTHVVWCGLDESLHFDEIEKYFVLKLVATITDVCIKTQKIERIHMKVVSESECFNHTRAFEILMSGSVQSSFWSEQFHDVGQWIRLFGGQLNMHLSHTETESTAIVSCKF